jgi:hypothetical protein
MFRDNKNIDFDGFEGYNLHKKTYLINFFGGQ